MNCKLGVVGAIGLAMHLMDCDFKTALRRLDENFACPCPLPGKERLNAKAFRPPPICNIDLPAIIEYLCSRRLIPLHAADALLESGRLYLQTP